MLGLNLSVSVMSLELWFTHRHDDVPPCLGYRRGGPLKVQLSGGSSPQDINFHSVLHIHVLLLAASLLWVFSDF